MENEEKYKAIKAEILGEDSEDESGSEEESSGNEEEEGRIGTSFFSLVSDLPLVEEQEGIQDQTGTNVVNLRRMIYLTIMNALNYEEAVHKLLKIQLNEGEEVSCSVSRTGIISD